MRTHLLLTILFITCTNSLFSQPTVGNLKTDSTKLYVKYASYTGYENDSIYRHLLYGSLYLGSLGTVYTYQLQTVDEMVQRIKRSLKGKEEWTKKFVLEESLKSRDWERQLTEILVRYYNAHDYLSLKKFDRDFYWLTDTVPFNWKPVNEFKTINNYRCQKAIINTEGANIEAWFTEEIPVSAGPDKIFGLPGLILEYSNFKTKTYFKAAEISSTNIPDQKFRNWLEGPLISSEKYKKLMEENTRNFENFQKMIQSGNTGKST